MGFANVIKLGLDLKGGVYAVFAVDESDDMTGEEIEKAVNGTVDSFQRILFNKGYTEANVVKQGATGDWYIRVEVPDVDDPSAVFDLIGNPAYLEFKKDDTSEPYITGKHVVDAYVAYQDSSPVVVLKLNAEGTTLFQQATTDNLNSSIGIYVNGTKIADPTVNSVISDGNAIISGVGTYEQCNALALQIQGGSFSVDLSIVENRVISPTLGINAIKTSLLAGIIGLIIIMLFMIFMYRLLGAAASIALAAYIVITIIVLASVPWVQLTLSGIGGIILGIGMAVDANIVIFERIKDEYSKGKPLQAAITVGFKRAGIAVFDSNLTTIIGAVALLAFGPASLQSFAITLIISIVLSFLTALFLTRRIVKLLLVLDKKPLRYNLKTKTDVPKGPQAVLEKFKKVKITEKYRRWLLIPAAVLLISFIVFAATALVGKSAAKGMNLGIDFTGGTILTVDLSTIDGTLNIDNDDIYNQEVDRITAIIEDKGFNVSLVQRVDGNVIQVRYQNDTKDANDAIITELSTYYTSVNAKFDATDISSYYISASSSAQLLLKALLAVAVALIATLIYIAFRFKLRYGLAAVLTLIHDVILLIAATIIFRVSVNASFIAAIVTIIGYAINNVIIIFDRIRENISLLENKTKFDTSEIADRSIGETVTRSIFTTFTTLITIVLLAIMGESSMREFALPIIIGLLIGLYSSLFVAPSLWSLFVRDGMRRAAEKKGRLHSGADELSVGKKGLTPVLATASDTESYPEETELEKPIIRTVQAKPVNKNAPLKTFKKKK
jgi:SecD/SecF fusion protein